MGETIRDLVLNAGTRFENQVALRYEDEQRTYGELIGRATRLANALGGLGLRPGDRVAGMIEDGLEGIEPHLAAAIGGFVFVVVNHRSSSAEVVHALSHSGARALVHTSGVSEVVDAADCADQVEVLTMGAERPRGGRDYEAQLAAASPLPPAASAGPGDAAMVAYTSGTTGRPKGAVFTHRALVRGADVHAQLYRVPTYGRLAFSASLSFAGTLATQIYPHLRTGGAIRMMGRLDPERWFAAMARDRTTATYLPTPVMATFTDLARKNPEVIQHLDTVFHSASPARPEDIAELVEVVGDRFIEVWGSTETMALTATTPSDGRGLSRARDPLATVGRAVQSARVFLRDDEGRELSWGTDEIGELWATCDTRFSFYWDDVEATEASTVDGAYRTGDLGRIDAEGYVYVSGGRRSDMINSGGMNVYPVEVEQALLRHPDIVDAAVFGLPHERWGETVAAAVSLRHGATVDQDDVFEHLRPLVAGYKKPTQVFFVADMPKTVSGKIKKAALKAELTRGR